MLLDELDDDARSIGACNLIACEDGRFKGYNSEWEALLAVLKRREMRPRLNRAMVIGTGAAARAAMYALWRGGFSRMTLAGRNTARAGAIVRGLGFIMGVDAKVVRYPDEASLVDVGQIDLVVNATPLGREDEDPLGGRELRVGLDVVDLAAPDEGTALSRRAEAAGCRVVKGTEVGAEVARLDVATWSKGA
jgi:shikimate dehydrogenase